MNAPQRLITDAYVQELRKLHAEEPLFGCSAHRHVNLVRQFEMADILDYGCGKRTLQRALGLKIQNYDPAIKGQDASPKPADLVYCGDVLEHIETECLDAVMEDLARVTKKVAILYVATRPARKTLSDGRNAHLIIKPAEWWRDTVSNYFTINDEMLDGDKAVTFVCEPLRLPTG